MDTLGSTTRTIITNEEDRSIDIGFECAAVIPAGTMVKLLNTGLVAAVTALTDRPLGMVTIGNKEAGGKVTVKTPFVGIQKAEASGIVPIGADLAAEALNVGGDLMKYKVAVATNYISAIALTGGAALAEITVGILRDANLKA